MNESKEVEKRSIHYTNPNQLIFNRMIEVSNTNNISASNFTSNTNYNSVIAPVSELSPSTDISSKIDFPDNDRSIYTFDESNNSSEIDLYPNFALSLPMAN